MTLDELKNLPLEADWPKFIYTFTMVKDSVLKVRRRHQLPLGMIDEEEVILPEFLEDDMQEYRQTGHLTSKGWEFIRSDLWCGLRSERIENLYDSFSRCR